jgi:hypothetical protein
MAFVQGEYFQGLYIRVHQPGMAYLMCGIDGQLVHPVRVGGGRRQNPATPIERRFEMRRLRQGRHPLAPPTGEIGDQNAPVRMWFRSSRIHQQPGQSAQIFLRCGTFGGSGHE